MECLFQLGLKYGAPTILYTEAGGHETSGYYAGDGGGWFSGHSQGQTIRTFAHPTAKYEVILPAGHGLLSIRKGDEAAMADVLRYIGNQLNLQISVDALATPVAEGFAFKMTISSPDGILPDGEAPISGGGIVRRTNYSR